MTLRVQLHAVTAIVSPVVTVMPYSVTLVTVRVAHLVAFE
jgi:hypothetical protein